MNIYQPFLASVTDVVDETPDTRTLRLEFQDEKVREGFDFKAGQFGEYGVFGAGESTFCIASSPTREGYIECSFKAIGKVTTALREVNVGDTVGFRGPYGNWFPVDDWKGKDIVFVAGGIGLAPVRCVIWNVLDRRDEFGDVTIVYGARSVDDLVYKRELEEWGSRSDVKIVTTVDPGGETKDWTGEVGYVTPVVEKTAPMADNAVAVLCGPPIVVKLTLPVLEQLGFADDAIFTTLENRMKCGLGKCGRCNIGPVYVCKDGPVFTAAQMKLLPPEFWAGLRPASLRPTSQRPATPPGHEASVRAVSFARTAAGREGGQMTFSISDSMLFRGQYKRKFRFSELYSAYVLVPRALATLRANRRSGMVDTGFVERLMLAVTEVNGCAACSWAHTRMALREGLPAEEISGLLSGDGRYVPPAEAKGILFAQHFADARGVPQRAAYAALVDEYGPTTARVILSAVQVMLAGNIYGIPSSAFYARLQGRPYADSTLTYELAMQIGGLLVIPVALVHALLRALAGEPGLRLDAGED